MIEDSKKMYDYVTSKGPLTLNSFKELVRICGYAPTDEQVTSIPKDYEEFLEITDKYEKKYTKQSILDTVVAVNSGENMISKEELLRILHTGQRLSNEEIETFLAMLPEERDGFCINNLVDMLWESN